MNALRPYQQDLYDRARESLLKNRSVCIQLATGGGKTPIASAIVDSVLSKNKRAWFVTPRRNLVDQASEHFTRWGVSHSRIDAKNKELKSFKIFVVSKETLTRRWDKIINWPDLIMIDEAHLNLDFQIELFKRAPINIKFILFTATPQRLDGRGLSVKGGGIADALIEGPSIPELTRKVYLTPLRYFSPPLEGLADLKTKGIDYNEEELEELLKRKKIYGEVVGHYEKYGKGKPALGFCRSVKSAYQMAERFQEKGFNFHCIEGTQDHSKIKTLLNALRDGEIEGLTTCDLILYGVDVPRVEYGFSIRPTLSFSLLMQMIGRLLRPFKDEKTGYVKQYALWFDHVNMLLEHGIAGANGMLIPPHYAEHIEWNFDGTEKHRRDKLSKNAVMCPHLDFMYCDNPHCASCGSNPDKTVTDARKPMIIVPAELVEIKSVPLAEREPDDQREIQDRIGSAILEYKSEMSPGAVGKLLAIADELGRRPEWVYYTLTREDRKTVNVPLLYEIARIKKFKPGWAYWKMKEIRGRKLVNQKYDEAMA